MRILGVDYGTKRIGLAISDPLGIFAQPFEMVAVVDEDFDAAAGEIAEIAAANDVGQLVVGLPRNMDDTVGFKAKEALAFGELLAEKSGLPVATWDERLSTAQAERHLRETGLSRGKRKKKVDMMAAQIILQGYMASQGV